MRMNITPQGTVNNAMQLVYETTLTEAATSVTISGLTGDTAELYELVVISKNAYDGSMVTTVRLNGSVAYCGYQRLAGSGSTPSGLASTTLQALYLSYHSAIDRYSTGAMTIYAKSGHPRFSLHHRTSSVTGTTVGYAGPFGQVWPNTADELTSITVYTGRASGIGIGTYIALYQKGVVT